MLSWLGVHCAIKSLSFTRSDGALEFLRDKQVSFAAGCTVSKRILFNFVSREIYSTRLGFSQAFSIPRQVMSTHRMLASTDLKVAFHFAKLVRRSRKTPEERLAR